MNLSKVNVKKTPAVLTPEVISVVLADDHMVVRQGLKALLEIEGDIKVIGEAEDGRRAVELTREFKPMVVVMDIMMPKMNGLEAARQILKELPATRIILLSAHNDDAYIEEAARIKVAGYLIKQSSLEALSKLIRHKQQREGLFMPANTWHVKEENFDPEIAKKARKKITALSSREMELLQLIAEGRSNKQVASDLDISIKTVEKHRQNLMLKLNLHDTAGITRYAISKGIIESGVQLIEF